LKSTLSLFSSRRKKGRRKKRGGYGETGKKSRTGLLDFLSKPTPRGRGGGRGKRLRRGEKKSGNRNKSRVRGSRKVGTFLQPLPEIPARKKPQKEEETIGRLHEKMGRQKEPGSKRAQGERGAGGKNPKAGKLE